VFANLHIEVFGEKRRLFSQESKMEMKEMRTGVCVFIETERALYGITSSSSREHFTDGESGPGKKRCGTPTTTVQPEKVNERRPPPALGIS